MGIPSISARNGALPPTVPPPVARLFAQWSRHMRGAPYDFETDGGAGATALVGDGKSLVARAAGHEFLSQVALMGHADLPVLLVGGNRAEVGDVARLLHESSPRATHPFAEVNCLAFHEDAVALDLFGGEVIGSSGENYISVGLLERCHGGTVLLTEITGMPWRWQARLVDLMDEQQLCRLGGRSWVTVDVKIIVSTSMNIGMALAAGKLRTDLYYRLQSLTLDSPPSKGWPGRRASNNLAWRQNATSRGFGNPVPAARRPA